MSSRLFETDLTSYEKQIVSSPIIDHDYSTDFDGDNIIEIPTFDVFPYAEHISKGTNERVPFNVTVWNELNDNSLIIDKKCIQNSFYKYFLII